MAFTLPNVPTLVAIAAIDIGLLFQIIGYATPGWYIYSGSKLGLWQECSEYLGIDRCHNIDRENEVDDSGKAIRAFGLLGIFVMVGSAICGILICFLRSHQQILFLGATFNACLGAVFSLIEWAIYVGKAPTKITDHLGYSFALTVVATILCIIATVLFFLGRTKNSVS